MSTETIQAYTVAEAAKALDVSPGRVYQLLDEGELAEAGMIATGKLKLVSAASVEALKAKRQASGSR